jgi:hypothetical protein
MQRVLWDKNTEQFALWSLVARLEFIDCQVLE